MNQHLSYWAALKPYGIHQVMPAEWNLQAYDILDKGIPPKKEKKYIHKFILVYDIYRMKHPFFFFFGECNTF